MTRRIGMALVALALAVSVPGLAQTGGDLRAQIEKQSQAWQKAYNAGDAAGLTALYATDGMVMAPGVEPASGAAAIRKFFDTDVKSGAKNTLTTQDVVGSGEYALETGKWVATSADGKHLDHGQYSTTYKKADGGWKIYRDIWNSSMAKK
ncbi:MAG: SgcJ/EcaC family oxidoreductase [Gemmatimonadales bacterium]